MGDYSDFTIEEIIEPQRWSEFEFFNAFGTNGLETKSIYFHKNFKLGEIRLHLSVAFASAGALIAQLSSVKGSAYNTKLLSTDISGTIDLFIHYSDPILFLSNDHLKFTISLVSGTNIIGMTVRGWAALG